MSNPGIFLIQPNGDLVKMNEELASLKDETLNAFFKVIEGLITKVEDANQREQEDRIATWSAQS